MPKTYRCNAMPLATGSKVLFEWCATRHVDCCKHTYGLELRVIDRLSIIGRLNIVSASGSSTRPAPLAKLEGSAIVRAADGAPAQAQQSVGHMISAQMVLRTTPSTHKHRGSCNYRHA